MWTQSVRTIIQWVNNPNGKSTSSNVVRRLFILSECWSKRCKRTESCTLCSVRVKAYVNTIFNHNFGHNFLTCYLLRSLRAEHFVRSIVHLCIHYAIDSNAVHLFPSISTFLVCRVLTNWWPRKHTTTRSQPGPQTSTCPTAKVKLAIRRPAAAASTPCWSSYRRFRLRNLSPGSGAAFHDSTSSEMSFLIKKADYPFNAAKAAQSQNLQSGNKSAEPGAVYAIGRNTAVSRQQT